MKRLLIMIILMSFAFTQSVTLTMASPILESNLNRLSINDFDFIGAGKTKELFRGTIKIRGIQNNSTKFKMEFYLKYNNRDVVSAYTKQINGIGNDDIVFTNTQISQNITAKLYDGGSANLKFENLTLDKSFISADNISAKLPDGRYQLLVIAYLNGNPVANVDKKFELQQNWPINLMNPIDEINTSTPLFQWDSRAAKYPKVTLYVWANDGSKSSSIAKRPILEKVFENMGNNVIPTSFSFPADNSRPLEDGKSYFWTTRVTIVTAAGPKEEPNEILEFQYKKPKNSNINATAVNNILQQLLGTAFDVFKAEFAGYDLKDMTINGESAQINNLATYIQKVTSGEVNILVETF